MRRSTAAALAGLLALPVAATVAAPAQAADTAKQTWVCVFNKDAGLSLKEVKGLPMPTNAPSVVPVGMTMNIGNEYLIVASADTKPTDKACTDLRDKITEGKTSIPAWFCSYAMDAKLTFKSVEQITLTGADRLAAAPGASLMKDGKISVFVSKTDKPDEAKCTAARDAALKLLPGGKLPLGRDGKPALPTDKAPAKDRGVAAKTGVEENTLDAAPLAALVVAAAGAAGLGLKRR